MLSKLRSRACALLILVLAAPSHAERVFTALLTGDSSVPPNGSTAGAVAKLTLSDDESSIRLSLVYEGINPADLIGLHIHDAPPAVAGNIIIDVGPSGSPRLNFTAPVPTGQLDDLLAGEWYLDLHTTAFGGGEIRGQFAPPTADAVAVARLNSLEEVPPNRSRAHGFGRIDFAITAGGGPGFASMRLLGVATPVTGAHIHGRAFPFQNAGVLFDLGAPSANGVIGDALVSLDVAQGIDLRAGLLYFNVHTGANPGGEIRGQIIPSTGVTYVALPSGAQTVPPNASAATGHGIVVLYAQATNAKVSLRFENLSTNNTESWLYVGPPGSVGGQIEPIGSSGTTSGLFIGRNVNTDLPGLPDLDAHLANGNAYLNVHSQAFPNGEIRGQLRRLEFVHADDFE